MGRHGRDPQRFGSALFAAGEPLTRSWPAAVTGVVLVPLLTWLSLLRQEGVPAWQSLWAEDGKVFLAQAVADGWHSVTTPYAGYGHLLPRLLGVLAAALPLDWAPWVQSVGAAAVVALLAAYVAVACRSHVRSRLLRVVMAFALALTPSAQVEALNNTANLQWFLLMALFWALLWDPAERRWQVASGVVGLLAVGSAPLAALLAPLVLWRLWCLRRRGLDWLLAGMALGGIFQIYVGVGAPKRVGASWDTAALVEGWVVRAFVQLPGIHGAHVLGTHLGWWAAVLVVAAVLVPLLLAGLVDRRVLGLGAVALAASAVELTVALDRGNPTLPGHLSTMDALNLNGASRYDLFPAFLVVVVVVVALDALLRRGCWSVVALPVVVLVLIGFVGDFRGGYFRSRSPHWSTQLDLARVECTAGAGLTTMPIAPPPFVVVLPCTAVGR